MIKKYLLFTILILSFQIAKAQQEFITIWKPSSNVIPPIDVDAPYQANSQQIWFPGIGDNYTIEWEEVGAPQHKGTLTDVTSTKQVLIDFGAPMGDGEPTYRVKVSNGNGAFRQIKFGEAQLFQLPIHIFPFWQINGSADKILEIEQWGDISWTTMNSAFANCKLIQLTATDTPILDQITDASFMFYGTVSLAGAPSMQHWNTSTIQNFSFMFSLSFNLLPNTPLPHQFNPPYLNSWNMSSATNLSYMFSGRPLFNQSINDWDVSRVTDMSWMFADCKSYNQPMNKWNTENLEDIHYMFHFIPVFNQPLPWNTSKITNMAHAIHACTAFNQPLESWDTTNVTSIEQILNETPSFNQALGKWNLASVSNASYALSQTGMDCENYSKTLAGWADNPNTANNIILDNVEPLKYASNATGKRDILINKGWTINGDIVGNCLLSSSEVTLNKKPSLYPNPATDDIYIEGLNDMKGYKILDASGRLIKEGNSSKDMINITDLPKGNYIIQLILKEKIFSSKFIKK